ncbi:nuclear transport factor 2 family protein [Streptococcus thoraltensis]|uniref:nuclear transport factor 2 family protein n=1 Tax=Streptococcus thoraltensis TaxID=55085 RepID=UPI0003609AD1|nr:nuclear transport factor 2 family protein [Streptococcus thoraltensis]MDY4761264.1 nuclear transport factor 2 family protein [Streptococcus thoraltensis]
MSQNIQNAKALINTFVSGDVDLARQLLAPDYIQHNQAYATGADAFIAAVEGLAQAPVKTTAETIRAFEDGDKVFLHTIYNFAGGGEQVAFDILRFNAEGKIVEHWDNLDALAEPNPSGRTQTDGVTETTEADKEVTRTLVTNFVQDILHGKNLDKLTSYFDGDRYIQHNTGIADGLSGLGAALAALAEAGLEMTYKETYQVLAQDDFALVVSEGEFAGRHVAYYDLFRVENGFIAEHWDIIQDIATEAANDNGKF